MQTRPINFQNIDDIVTNLKKGNYKYYQFYNLEIEADEYNFIQYMLKYNDSKKAKVLNKTYYDIETYVNEKGEFTDPIEVDRPVNSIALYNNIKNTVYVISFVTDCNITDADIIEKGVRELYDTKVKENQTYEVKDIILDIRIVEDEKKLITTFWSLMKEQNTLILAGYNSSIFDDIFMFNRTIKLFGLEQAKNIISEFGQIDQYNTQFEIPDYLLVDILKLYKPVGQGGGGLGKSLPDFKLNTVAKKVLGITKLDLDKGFREAYLTDIIGYLTYNMFDTILTYKIDMTLQFMELMFDLSKYNNTTMGTTIAGRSVLYQYRDDLIYTKQKKIIRSKKFAREVLYESKIVTT